MFHWGLSAWLLCIGVIVTCAANDFRKMKSFTEIRRELSQCGRSHYEEPEDAFQGLQGAAHAVYRFLVAGKRVVGGEASRHGEWPWLVSLSNSNRNLALMFHRVSMGLKVHGSHYCAGVLIHPQWVLSARHCFAPDNWLMSMASDFGKDIEIDKPHDWTAVVGEHEIEREDSTERRVKIRKIFLAPNITDGSGTFIRDIALLRLDTPVRRSRYVRPACLPEDEKVKPGDSCMVAGWGKTSNQAREHSAKLLHARVKIRSPLECAFAYQWSPWKFHKSSEICAVGDDFRTDTCEFDSGGPLMCRTGSNRWAVSGIVSRGGIECAKPGYPGIYASVRYSLDWIAHVLYQNQ